MSAFGPSASSPHYFPDKDTSLRLENGLYLVDAGGHYLDGTTDISRTILLGSEPATDHQKKVYTLALMGLLNVERFIVDDSQKLSDLDVAAKEPLK